MAATNSDPMQIIRSRKYVGLLLIAAVFGIPVSLAAYIFMYVVNSLQKWIYTDIPVHFSSAVLRLWWPVVPLAAAGLIVGLAVKYLPGHGGEVPIEGFKAGAKPVVPSMLVGIVLAAVASIGLGAVVGPEAPLIALGGGLAYWWIRLVRRNVPDQAAAVISASGSFAAISTLFGSPLNSSFLLMEASGLGGLTMDLVLLPGLLAAGIGYLIFLGLDAWTGLGTFSLSIPNIPPFGTPTIAEFAWAIGIGLIAPLLAFAIRLLAIKVRPGLERRLLINTILAGLVVALLAALFVKLTHQSNAYILFSGQDQLGQLISGGASLSVKVLVLVLLFKGVAYSLSLVAFRGGPTFPSMFLGAALGILLSSLPGLPLIAGVAMGIGAMAASMLKLPLTSVLLATLLLLSDGLKLMPLVIVAVVVAYVVTMRLAAKPRAAEVSQ